MVTVHRRDDFAGGCGRAALPSSSAALSSSRLFWLATILVVFSFAVLQFGPLRIGPGGGGGGGIHAFSLEEPSKAEKAATTFSLMVELQFSNETAKQTFLHEIAPLADYVEQYERETGTLTYQVLQSDRDPLHVLMMERYAEKDNAYKRVHKQSTAFLAFRPKLQAMQDAGQVTITGHSYSDTRVGFSHRGGVVAAVAGTTTAASRGGVAGDGEQ